MTHRINNDEMNPKTECGLKIDAWSAPQKLRLALAHETPTCKKCRAKDSE